MHKTKSKIGQLLLIGCENKFLLMAVNLIDGRKFGICCKCVLIFACLLSGALYSTRCKADATSVLHFTSKAAPEAAPFQKYSFRLKAFGGRLPYTFRVLSGRLPAGLKLSLSGKITGLPHVERATNTIVFDVSDSNHRHGTQKNVINVDPRNLHVSHLLTQENETINDDCFTRFDFVYTGAGKPKFDFYAFSPHSSSATEEAPMSDSLDPFAYSWDLPKIVSSMQEVVFYASGCDDLLFYPVVCSSFFGTCR